MATKKKKTVSRTPSSTSTKVHKVVHRGLNDKAYGRKMAAAAKKAMTGGAGSKEWEKYFANFASSPGELATLGLAKHKGRS